MTTSGIRWTNIPKAGFPGLLKKLEAVMEPNRAENLRTGFRQTRIFPNDKQVLKRLPSYADKDNLGHLSACVGAVFLDDLKKNQVEVTGKKIPHQEEEIVQCSSRWKYWIGRHWGRRRERFFCATGNIGRYKKRDRRTKKEEPLKKQQQRKIVGSEEFGNGNGSHKRNKQQPSRKKRQKKQKKKQQKKRREKCGIRTERWRVGSRKQWMSTDLGS